MTIIDLHYSKTNTYLIKGEKGTILFDTGWAGTFKDFCRSMKEIGEKIKNIDYILISHYHPDHMGIAQEIADKGSKIVACDFQMDYIHNPDVVFEKEHRRDYKPVVDKKVQFITASESRAFLSKLGIEGEMIHTPGHSDDSLTLILDSGEVFVGDLNPLYEYELNKGTEIEDSWKTIFEHKPTTVYYGHAKTLTIDRNEEDFLNSEYVSGKKKVNYDTLDEMTRNPEGAEKSSRLEKLKSRRQKAEDRRKNIDDIIRYIQKGYSIDMICHKTDSDREYVEDVMRMLLTHPGISTQGIIDRIEIKGK
jgi:glyoxylase-like metal-dependent hydrolase (beta-lactamase superfamily II)